MSNQTPPSTKSRSAFIDARITRARLVKEQTTSAPARPSAEPKQIQVKADTNGEYSVSVNEGTTPEELLVQCNLKVAVKQLETEMVLVEYESTYNAQFTVIERTGFDKWLDAPLEVFGPFFAMIQYLALAHAENTLEKMGLAGIYLPRQLVFGEGKKITEPSANIEPAQGKSGR
jgi:hypothetical protein